MLKKLFKLFCFSIMALVVGTMAFRIYTLNHYPAFAKGVADTEALCTSYKDGVLSGITWDIPAEFDATGDFFVSRPIYFENEQTLIFTVRYNDSLLEEWKHEGNGEDLLLDVTVYADGKERIEPLTYTYGHAYGLYSYRRYVFEGVSLSDYDILYVDIYNGETDYSVSPYSSVAVYESSWKTEPYKLSASDKKILK
ncbi:MAG: hypothetical protein IIX18_00960 [Clostridia bacterium]|nr:hypothetical protein [Clostridia bacterium]MBQ6613869.1 hypothetical protein [Clostridia bacterium]